VLWRGASFRAFVQAYNHRGTGPLSASLLLDVAAHQDR
jgi:hypothetical protein